MKKHTYALNIGNITIFYEGEIVHEVRFGFSDARESEISDLTQKTYREIIQFLDGERFYFDIPFKKSGTAFQKQVLDAISAIPYGQVRSYKQIAEDVGRPKAYRAVASVCSHNKLPLLIPCHRVLRSDGQIGEYLGGGKVKKQLLEIENYYSNI